MKKPHKIGIIDYGINNILSVYNAFQKLNCEVRVISKYESQSSCDGLILPGVGSFGEAMKNLNKSGLADFIKNEAIIKKTKFLGICLGMQLMANDSVELNYNKGLCLINGNIKKIHTKQSYRIPHVGWNNVITSNKSILFNGINDNSNFYFVHSYYYSCNEKFIIGEVDYGGLFTAAVQKDNLFGVQFHPERSQRVGFELLNNFVEFTN